MFCSKCGSEIAEGEEFCPKCGARVETKDSVAVKGGIDEGKNLWRCFLNVVSAFYASFVCTNKISRGTKPTRKTLIAVGCIAAAVVALSVGMATMQTSGGRGYNSYGGYSRDGGVALTKEGDFAVKFNGDSTGVIILGPKVDDRESIAKIVIPKSIEDVPVTEIAYNAFHDCTSCRYISIPDSVTALKCTFQKLESLETVRLPNTIKKVPNGMFFGCSSLKSVDLPPSVEVLGCQSFQNCTSLVSIELPKHSTVGIDSFAFRGCTSLEKVIIPKEIKKIVFGGSLGGIDLAFLVARLFHSKNKQSSRSSVTRILFRNEDQK